MNAKRPDEWFVGDGMGEMVRYYNPTGCVMVFIKSGEIGYGEDRWTTTDPYEAAEVARIAREVYKRRNMRIAMVA